MQTLPVSDIRRNFMIDEQLLVRQIAAGKETAMETVIDRYGAYVSVIVSNIIRPPLSSADVEEVVSDVFLALWKHPGDVSKGSLKGYLSAIARNRAKDKLRSFHITEPLAEDTLEITIPGPEALIEKKQLQEAMRYAVDQLEEPDRTIVLRYYYFYEKTEDIAKTMGIHPATVRTKLARSRQKLKTSMEAYLADEK